MKTILAACAFVFGCAETRKVSDIKACINMQKLQYGDLCAEHEGTEPNFRKQDAYYFGVKCGVEGVRDCLGIDAHAR